MPSNSSLKVTSLDFDNLKITFKDYLKAQETFKDYDFEGSNINVLLDVLSYNTFLNSFYLNMVASEMFLDSAQKLDSVVSHAKELNYVPQSNKSASANISFSITTSNINGRPLAIPKGSSFTGTNSNGDFNFVTSEEVNIIGSGNTYNISNLRVYEGSYINDVFVMDYSIETQKFVLSNPNIDTSSISVSVTENDRTYPTTFIKVDTLYNLNSKSNVFFLQAAQKGKYEILFGDNILGRKPQNGAVINVNYRISKGSSADGVYKFTYNSGLVGIGTNSISSITVNANSGGGGFAENIESIRFRAPRYFAAQQRAVSSDDFSSLILSNFGDQISDVNVFGGELLTPKEYGTVVVSLKSIGNVNTPSSLKNDIQNFMLNYISLPTKLTIADPDYLYIQVQTTVQYDKTLTSLYPNDIASAVLNTIKKYSTNNLEAFRKDFRYSRFVNDIDNSDIGIVSNDTNVRLLKRITPVSGVRSIITVEFNNPGLVEGNYPGKQYPDEPTLVSSAFTYTDVAGISYPLCYFRDDGLGTIFIFNIVNNDMNIINSSAGSVNYKTGIVTLNNIAFSNYGNYLYIGYSPEYKDLYADKNKILLIDPVNVTINVIDKQD